MDRDEMRNGDGPSAVRVLPPEGEHPESSPSAAGSRRRWFGSFAVVGFALLAFLATTRPESDPDAATTPSSLAPRLSAASDEPIDLTSASPAAALTNEWQQMRFEWSGQIDDIAPFGNSLVAIGAADGEASAWLSATGLGWRKAPRFETPDSAESSVAHVVSWNDSLVALGAVDDGVGLWAGGLWSGGSPSRWVYHGIQQEFGRAEIVGLAAGPELLAIGYVRGELAGWTSTDGMTWSSLGTLQGADQLRFALTLAGTPNGYLLGGEDDCGRGRCGATILRSPDGASWVRADVEQLNPQLKLPGSVRDIVVDNERMIAVGTEGLFPDVAVAVWTSEHGKEWARLAPNEVALQPATVEIELVSINPSIGSTAVIAVGGRQHQVGVGSRLETDAGPVAVTDVVADGIRIQHDGAEWLLRRGGTAKLQRISYPASVDFEGPRIVIAGAQVGTDARHPVIWASADGGIHWQRTKPHSDTGMLTAAVLDGANLVVAGHGFDGKAQLWHTTWNTQPMEDEGVALVEAYFEAIEQRNVDALVTLLRNEPTRFQVPSLGGVDLPWWDETAAAVDRDAVADTTAYLQAMNTDIDLGECRTRVLLGATDSLRVACDFRVESDLLSLYSNEEYGGTAEIVVANGAIQQVLLSTAPSALMWQMLTTGSGSTDPTIRALLDDPATANLDPVFSAESAPVHLSIAEEFLAGLLRPGDTRIIETNLGTMEWSWLEPFPVQVTYVNSMTHYSDGFIAIGQGAPEPWTEEVSSWTSQDGLTWERMADQPDFDGLWNLRPFRDGLIGQAWEQERSILAFYDGDGWTAIDLPGAEAAGGLYDVGYLATSGETALVVTFEWSEDHEGGPGFRQAWLVGPDGVPQETSLPSAFSEQADTIGLEGSDEGFLLGAVHGWPRSIQIWFSPDGYNWDEVAAATGIEIATYIWNLQSHNNRYFVIGEDYNCLTAGGNSSVCEHPIGLWSSPDGADWERVLTTSGEPVGAYELGSGPLGLVAMAVAADFYSDRPLPRPIYLSPDGTTWERAGNLALWHPEAEWWWASLPAVGTDTILFPGSAYKANTGKDTPFLIVGRVIDD